jgi:hypothetical protein
LAPAYLAVRAIAPATPEVWRAGSLHATITLGDIGFVNGFRFANLGGHREVFVPVPQSGDVATSALVLAIDDMSAHEARRNLQVLVNGVDVAAVVLDGKSGQRVVRVPLAKTPAKDGFVKLSFFYSGAMTPDRCVDVRYVGDSLTIRPETAIEVDVSPTSPLDVSTTALGCGRPRAGWCWRSRST